MKYIIIISLFLIGCNKKMPIEKEFKPIWIDINECGCSTGVDIKVVGGGVYDTTLYQTGEITYGIGSGCYFIEPSQQIIIATVPNDGRFNYSDKNKKITLSKKIK